MRSCAARRRAVTKGVRDELQGVHEDHVHYGRWRVCLDFASDTLLFDAPNLEAATMVAVHATFTAARSVAELGCTRRSATSTKGRRPPSALAPGALEEHRWGLGPALASSSEIGAAH
jgi:hypothetical protein